MGKIELKGYVKLRLVRKGKVILLDEGPNLVVDYGKEFTARCWQDPTAVANKADYLHLGDSGNAVVGSQTDLEGTAFAENDQATTSRVDNITTHTFALTHSGGPATFTTREMGIFDDASRSNMFARWLPLEFDFASGDTLNLTWALTFGGA